MAITEILDHQSQALDRLLQQYKESSRLRGTINDLAAHTQIAETTFFDLIESRFISTSAGIQLDRIGELVGLVRPSGMSDANYRPLLYAQIGRNNSQGFIEQIISVFKLITQADKANLQELFPAAIMVMTSNEIDSSLVNLLYEFSQSVICAGLRCDHIGYWATAGDGPFSLAGAPNDGSGLGDSTDSTIGGTLGALYVPTIPEFVIAGNGYSLLEAGLGDLTDSVVGGFI